MLTLLKKREISNEDNTTKNKTNDEIPMIIMIRKIIAIHESDKTHHTKPFITVFKSVSENNVYYEYFYNINDLYIHNELKRMKVIFKTIDKIIFGTKTYEKYVCVTVSKNDNFYFATKIANCGYSLFYFWKIYIKNVIKKLVTFEDLKYYNANNKILNFSKLNTNTPTH